MKSTLYLLATALPAVLAQAGCNANNCARALTGTAAGTSRAASRISTDCYRFYSTATFYPPLPTTYITSGSVAATTPAAAGTDPVATYVFPSSALPEYAQQACANSNGGIGAGFSFGRACRCAGVPTSIIKTFSHTRTATVIVPTPSAPFVYCGNPVTDGGAQPYDPFCTTPGDCLCVQIADGSAACINNQGCGTKACSTNTQCGSNSVCVVGTPCKSSSAGVCANTADFLTCFNAAAPSRLFRKRASGSQMYDAGNSFLW